MFRVGILDTDLFPNPELNGRYVTGDVLAHKAIYRSWEGHAAFVAGRILSRAPGADLDVRAVLGENGRGSSWEVAKQMASFLGSGVDIIVLPFGAVTSDAEEPLLLTRAVDVLAGQTVLVAAAGNHGDQPPLGDLDGDADALGILATLPRYPNSPIWPAALPNVTAVGATDPRGHQSADGLPPLATFTPRVPWLDLRAPGVGVPSTFIDGEVERVTVELAGGHLEERRERLGPFKGAAKWNGTSFAAGDATGAIVALAGKRGLTARQALQVLLHADHDDYQSAGLPDDVRPALPDDIRPMGTA